MSIAFSCRSSASRRSNAQASRVEMRPAKRRYVKSDQKDPYAKMFFEVDKYDLEITNKTLNETCLFPPEFQGWKFCQALTCALSVGFNIFGAARAFSRPWSQCVNEWRLKVLHRSILKPWATRNQQNIQRSIDKNHVEHTGICHDFYQRTFQPKSEMDPKQWEKRTADS